MAEITQESEEHVCDRQGVPAHYGAEWDGVEDGDLALCIVQTAVYRVVWPMRSVRLYLFNRLLEIFNESNSSNDLYEEFGKYLMWLTDFAGFEGQLATAVATSVAARIPDRFTTLDRTLREALVESGLCCEDATNKFIASTFGEKDLELMEGALPDFKKEWLTLNGERPSYEKPPKPVFRSWASEPVKKPEPGQVYVSLRGKVKGIPVIKVVDRVLHGVDYDKPGLEQGYDVELKIEAGETVFTVGHAYADLKLLQEECRAMFDESGESRDVEVSGMMVWSGSVPFVHVERWGLVHSY